MKKKKTAVTKKKVATVGRTYGIRPGYRIKGDPQKIGEEFEVLGKKHRGLKRDVVWKAAKKNKKSPLHPNFTWDVKQAAEKRWNDEAGYLMQAVTVITYAVEDVEKKEVAARALLGIRDNPSDPNAGTTYYPRHEVFASKKKRDTILQDAILYLKAGYDKYYELTELDHIWKEIAGLSIDDLLKKTA